MKIELTNRQAEAVVEMLEAYKENTVDEDAINDVLHKIRRKMKEEQ